MVLITHCIKVPLDWSTFWVGLLPYLFSTPGLSLPNKDSGSQRVVLACSFGFPQLCYLPAGLSVRIENIVVAFSWTTTTLCGFSLQLCVDFPVLVFAPSPTSPQSLGIGPWSFHFLWWVCFHNNLLKRYSPSSMEPVKWRYLISWPSCKVILVYLGMPSIITGAF